MPSGSSLSSSSPQVPLQLLVGGPQTTHTRTHPTPRHPPHPTPPSASADIASPGLVSVSDNGSGTRVVQLHLGRLCAVGEGQGCAAAVTRGGAAASAAVGAADPGPGKVSTQYVRSAEPSRHLVLLGVSREVAPALAARAAALGHVQKHFYSGPNAFTIHFEQQATAEALAAEAVAGAVPGLAGERRGSLVPWPRCHASNSHEAAVLCCGTCGGRGRCQLAAVG